MVHTAYSWISLACRSFFMICASARKSFGSMVPGLSVFIATGVVLFHRPSHTSPNWPCPSFLRNFNDERSISHWSRVR